MNKSRATDFSVYIKNLLISLGPQVVDLDLFINFLCTPKNQTYSKFISGNTLAITMRTKVVDLYLFINFLRTPKNLWP